MRTVSIYLLRNNLATYLDDVINSETPMIVSRFGKPVALLSPYEPMAAVSFKRYFGFMGGEETGEEFVNRIRRSKKELGHIENLRNRT